MKKKLFLIIIAIFIIIISFKCKLYLNNLDADKKINNFITKEANIPLSEILVINPTKENGHFGDSDKNYIKFFTTKKDFKKWKETLKKDEKNITVKDCEIKYSCSYAPKVSKYNQINIYSFGYILAGNTVDTLNLINDNFEYTPTESIKKLLKEQGIN